MLMAQDHRSRQKAAKELATNWKGRGYEKGDSQVFWTEILRDIVGIKRVSSEAKFEYRTADGGFIDVFIPDAGVLVEQKSLGIDLDTPELRQGQMVTPFEQARAYAESFKADQQPRFIVVSNFETFRVHDRNAHARAEQASNYFEFTLEELGEHPEYLNFISDPANSRLEKQKAVSIKAGELIGKLYSALREQYLDPDSAESQHSLNVLCVRLVFCLFCEDSRGLFPQDAFLNYLRNVEPIDMRDALKKLFRALNTPRDQRDPYDEKIKPFPYVNGGLFEEEVEIPNFTQDIKHLLLFEVSQQTDWSKIDPTVFGGIFESTLNPETRAHGGMHYTSLENIHKVIDPLFLDDLYAEFEAIHAEVDVTDRTHRRHLENFRSKLSSLRFLDPACGSGNFLTETYRSLRELEDDVLNDLYKGQTEIVFYADDEDRVTLDQFYGIEINDFAVRVAKTALWIAQLQANNDSESMLDISIQDFPLIDSANIVEGNALRMDWNDVLPASECNYIMGNPPFLGAYSLTEAQKEDRKLIFGNSGGILDYVACWYKVAANYMQNHEVHAALVSTNSITQGQQPEPLWKSLFDEGIHIDFAWTTFYWSSEASDPAHVHCVIIGFSKIDEQPRRLFKSRENALVLCNNINGYLQAAPNWFITKRTHQISGMPEMFMGCKPTGKPLIMEADEAEMLVKNEPQAEKWIRPFSMGKDFVDGEQRYCLWLVGITMDELSHLPLIEKRVEEIRDFRFASPKAATRKKADTPWLFDEIRVPTNNPYIGVPKVTSGKRSYIPMGFVENGMIPGDKLYFIDTDSLYVFGVLMSHMHMAWMRYSGGRLKSDYSYANTIIYNNFVFPNPTDGQKIMIEQAAQGVLDARAAHPNVSLAEMYDGISPAPLEASEAEAHKFDRFVFNDLADAHRKLDAAVEAAYGVDFQGDEEKIVAHLFKLYAEAVNNG